MAGNNVERGSSGQTESSPFVDFFRHWPEYTLEDRLKLGIEHGVVVAALVRTCDLVYEGSPSLFTPVIATLVIVTTIAISIAEADRMRREAINNNSHP